MRSQDLNPPPVHAPIQIAARHQAHFLTPYAATAPMLPLEGRRPLHRTDGAGGSTAGAVPHCAAGPFVVGLPHGRVRPLLLRLLHLLRHTYDPAAQVHTVSGSGIQRLPRTPCLSSGTEEMHAGEAYPRCGS